MPKSFLNWSSGKDAALALYLLQHQKEFYVEKLLTTVNADFDRVSMHGLCGSLLRKQAEHIGLPLMEVKLKGATSMEDYSQIMDTAFAKLKSEGFTRCIFGDIFLEDLKQYRDENLASVGLEGVYPLWKKDTAMLAYQIIDLGFKAITVTTSDKFLGRDFCGREYNRDFLTDLPKNVDPCGENGEFHTFVYDGPIFKKPVDFIKGKVVLRDSASAGAGNVNWETAFWYCDLIG